MINFFLKDKNKERTSLDAIVRFKGERFKVATGVSVNPKFWDAKKHRCKSVRDYPEASILNSVLDRLELQIKSILNECQVKGIMPTSEQIKSELRGSPKAKPTTVVELFDLHVEKSEYSILTKKKYMTAKAWIGNYQQHRKTKFAPSDIDQSWYDSFKRYFFSQTYEKKVGDTVETRHYTLNYFGSVIKCLKKVLADIGSDFEVSDDVRLKAFRTEEEESDAIYLTESELKRIVDFYPTDETIKSITIDHREHNIRNRIEALINSKNRFLIGCYTALRVSDFKRIDLTNVRDGFIRVKPKKGRKLNSDVVIPIHPVVRSIIDSGFDFDKKVSEQNLNRHIKEICKMVGINDPISITKTEGGKHVERVYEKWQLVTTHTARRSGATNMYKAGIPTLSIMKVTGHTTEKSFLKYIKISAEENAEMLANHSFFK